MVKRTAALSLAIALLGSSIAAPKPEKSVEPVSKKPAAAKKRPPLDVHVFSLPVLVETPWNLSEEEVSREHIIYICTPQSIKKSIAIVPASSSIDNISLPIELRARELAKQFVTSHARLAITNCNPEDLEFWLSGKTTVQSSDTKEPVTPYVDIDYVGRALQKLTKLENLKGFTQDETARFIKMMKIVLKALKSANININTPDANGGITALGELTIHSRLYSKGYPLDPKTNQPDPKAPNVFDLMLKLFRQAGANEAKGAISPLFPFDLAPEASGQLPVRTTFSVWEIGRTCQADRRFLRQLKKGNNRNIYTRTEKIGPLYLDLPAPTPP